MLVWLCLSESCGKSPKISTWGPMSITDYKCLCLGHIIFDWFFDKSIIISWWNCWGKSLLLLPGSENGYPVCVSPGCAAADRLSFFRPSRSLKFREILYQTVSKEGLVARLGQLNGSKNLYGNSLIRSIKFREIRFVWYNNESWCTAEYTYYYHFSAE